MTPEQTLDALLMLKVAFPNGDRGVDAPTIDARQELYGSVIGTWNYEAGMHAIRAVALSCKYPYPSLAELHEAYGDQKRPHPERQPVAGLLSDGNTPATPEEVRAACAEAIATVERNAVVAPSRGSRSLEQAEGERDRKSAATGEEA